MLPVYSFFFCFQSGACNPFSVVLIKGRIDHLLPLIGIRICCSSPAQWQNWLVTGMQKRSLALTLGSCSVWQPVQPMLALQLPLSVRKMDKDQCSIKPWVGAHCGDCLNTTDLRPSKTIYRCAVEIQQDPFCAMERAKPDQQTRLAIFKKIKVQQLPAYRPGECRKVGLFFQV